MPGTLIARDSYTSVSETRSSLGALAHSVRKVARLPTRQLSCRIGAGSIPLS